MRTILTTTGISLLLNTRREFSTKTPSDEQMRHYLRTKPEQASAEARSLLQFAEDDDELVLLHTETPDAVKCAELLREFLLNSKGFNRVRLQKLQFLEDEQHMETYGLNDLVNTLVNEVENALRVNQDVIINATSGFKAEVVYSTMIGMLYHVPVKYIYEKFERVVTFNPIELSWDTTLLLTYRWFFEWIDAEQRAERDVESRLKALPDPDRDKVQAMLTPTDGEGYRYLSPMGNALWKIFKRETEEAEATDEPPAAKETDFRKKIIKSPHDYPKRTEVVLEKIARLSWVEKVIVGNFENTTLARIKNFTEDGKISLLWAGDNKAVNIMVQTTAEGRLQTRKVADQIKDLLEIQ